MEKSNDTEKKSGRGGKREGAGRPRTVGATNRISYRVPDDIIAILDGQPNKSAFVIAAIRAYARQLEK